MPIRDAGNTLDWQKAMTGYIVGNNDSTNVIDQLAAGDAGKPPCLNIEITTTATSGGGATLAINLLTDSVSGFGSAVTIPLVAATAVANLTAGKVLYNGYLPQGLKRYCKLQYVVGTAVFTAGVINAIPVVDPQTNRNS